MKKLLTILFLFASIALFAQRQNKPVANFVQIQSPAFGVDTLKNRPWLYAGSRPYQKWTELATFLETKTRIDSFKIKTLTTVGDGGASTLVNGVLNIPNYAGGVTPLDYTFHWDGSKYLPFSAKKTVDPGYAYIYNQGGLYDAYPTFTNPFKLDGTFLASEIITKEQYNGTTSMSPGGFSTVWDAYGYPYQIAGLSGGGMNNLVQWSDSSVMLSTGIKDTAGVISGLIKVGCNNDLGLFSRPLIIDASKVNLPRMAANKYLTTDANHNVVGVDEPSGGSVLASGGLHLDGDTVKMGGATYEDIDVNLQNHDLSFYSSTASLGISNNDAYLASRYMTYKSSIDTRPELIEIYSSGVNRGSGIVINGDSILSSSRIINNTIKKITKPNTESIIFHRLYNSLSTHNYSGTIQDSTGIRYTRTPESGFQDSTLVTKHYVDGRALSATYTPTISAVTNISSVWVWPAIYSSVSNMVHVSINGGFTTSANGESKLSLTIPVTMSIPSSGSLPLGSGVVRLNGGTAFASTCVTRNSSTVVDVSFVETEGGSTGSFQVSFDYLK